MSDGPSPAGASDIPAWQPPTDPGAGSGYGASPYSPGGSQPPAQGPSPQWTKPTKAGLIPLRPLTLGAMLGATFTSFRRNPRPTLAIALSSQFAVGIISAVVIGLFLWAALPRLENVSSENSDTLTAGTIFGAILIYFVPIFLSVVAVAVLQGIVVVEVSRAVVGEKLTLRQLWGRTKGRFGALIGWSLILATVFLLLIGLLAALIAMFVITLGAVGILIGVLLGLLALALGVAAAVWLGTKLSLVPSAIVIERLPLRAAVARSWTLTTGHFWRAFGIQALVGVILSIAINLVTAPISMFAPMLGVLFDPTGSGDTAAIVVLVVVYVLTMAFVVVLSSISMIIQSSTSALVYIDLRMRKEGLDLELSRFIEERDSGAATSDNPYASPPVS